jgi:CheY-like chemotaxis protein
MQNSTILIVDDDIDARTILSESLRHQGYTTISAKDGHEALMLLSQIHFDLVLLDIILPDTSGLEMITPIKTLHPKIKILMLTVMDEDIAGTAAVHARMLTWSSPSTPRICCIP